MAETLWYLFLPVVLLTASMGETISTSRPPARLQLLDKLFEGEKEIKMRGLQKKVLLNTCNFLCAQNATYKGGKKHKCLEVIFKIEISSFANKEENDATG